MEPSSETTTALAIRTRGNGACTPARKAQRLRAKVLEAVSLKDIQRIVKQLIDDAAGGKVTAAKLLFDRLLGPPLPLDIEARLKSLETRVRKARQSR